MAIPSTAAVFAGSIDPHEELDWRVALYDIIEDGEEVLAGSWALEVLPEGVALGLEIMMGSGRDPELTSDNRGVLFWLAVNAAYQNDATFDSPGTDLPMRITFQTDAVPARKRQRTFLVHVEQL